MLSEHQSPQIKSRFNFEAFTIVTYLITDLAENSWKVKKFLKVDVFLMDFCLLGFNFLVLQLQNSIPVKE